MKKHGLTIGLIVIILVLLFWGQGKNRYAESSKKEKERIEQSTKRELKALRDSARFERNYRKSLEAENLTLRKASQKSDSTTIIWQKRYTHEKNKKFGHFTDLGYDSLVTGLYPN